MFNVFAAPADGARGSSSRRPDDAVGGDVPSDPAGISAPTGEEAPDKRNDTSEDGAIDAAPRPSAGIGRWPTREGRLTSLRQVPEEELKVPSADPANPGSAGSGTSRDTADAALPVVPASTSVMVPPRPVTQGEAPVPAWLAVKTGRPGASSAGSRVPPPVAPARPKRRHGWLLLVFLLMVVAPIAVSAWYLYTRAADQYASTLAFSVRREEGPTASDLLGGIAGFSGASSSDTDVLAEFIQSQNMVERIDALVDLRATYTKAEGDPVFRLMDDASIEDLVTYWNRAVTLYYDAAQGLIEVRVLAFEAQDAQDVAEAIYDESSHMINALTAIARDDTTRFARAEVELSVERLKLARTALTEFRSRTQIVDPNADIQGQMGLLNTLQAQLADSLIELDLLRETTRENDPRIRQTQQRIGVIEKRIDEERAKFGIGGGGASEQAFADLVGEYESLIVDREFAEQAYLSALTNFDAAQAEAQRQSRYLAAHIQPTLAESAEYPRREMILLAIAFFSLAAWGTATLIYYSIKDRR